MFLAKAIWTRPYWAFSSAADVWFRPTFIRKTKEGTTQKCPSPGDTTPSKMSYYTIRLWSCVTTVLVVCRRRSWGIAGTSRGAWGCRSVAGPRRTCAETGAPCCGWSPPALVSLNSPETTHTLKPINRLKLRRRCLKSVSIIISAKCERSEHWRRLRDRSFCPSFCVCVCMYFEAPYNGAR